MAFKMISISFSQDTISISLTLVPLSFINITSVVDHPTFTLRHSIYPITIVTVAIFKEKGTSTVLFIFEPITSVLSPQLARFVSPIVTLTMLLVNGPHTFVFVTILVELNTEAFFAVVSPVTNVSA
jgi:hypothetical protein